MIEVLNVPYTSQLGKPKMPKSWQTYLPGEGQVDMPVPNEAKIWWSAVSSMPHCVLWTPSDWQFFKSTFYLACHCYSGEAKYFAELRQREEKMGVTSASRLALRIRYIEPEDTIKSVNNVIAIPTRSQLQERLAGEN